MSKAQVRASGWHECSACLSHGRSLKDCSELGACRGPWGMGTGMQYDRMLKHKSPRDRADPFAVSGVSPYAIKPRPQPKHGFAMTQIASRYPFQPYRGGGVIDRLTNATGLTWIQPPLEGAPPGFYFDDMPPFEEKLIPQCDGYDPAKGHGWNLGNCNRLRDEDGDVPVTETCICEANTGRYGGPHCYEDMNEKLCGFENCSCQNFMYTGTGCPTAYLGQPCEPNTGAVDILHREPWDVSPQSGHGCICIDYLWRGANCPASMLGRSCGTRTAGGEYQRLDPDVTISRMSPLYPKAF